MTIARVRWLAISLLAATLASCSAPGSYPPNPALLDLPAGRWHRIHQQMPDDDVVFVRQRHGGSAFDTRRGRLILFGSDTHGRDWSNSPLFFDVSHLRWSRLYRDDDPATYKVDEFGVPVAGPLGNHPWAMHTFGLVEYDARNDALIVSSRPRHLEPGRFTNAVAHLWPNINRHPTWRLDLTSGRWKAFQAPAEPFFVNATSYDPHRAVVIGYKPSGVYELSGTPRRWRQVADRGLLSWGNNATFDTRRRTLVVFGSHEQTNDIVIYEPETGRHTTMPTPGRRPPEGNYVPIVYHPGVDRTVVLAERKAEAADGAGRTETWLYDLGTDSWDRVARATLPFPVGMNYNLEFDPVHGVLLLVANPSREPTAVWALRIE